MFWRRPTLGFRIDVIVEPDETGFHAYCPALKGLHVSGDTEEGAVQNARDAALAYLGSLIKHHDPIPVGIIAWQDPTGKPAVDVAGVKHHTEDLKVACTI